MVGAFTADFNNGSHLLMEMAGLLGGRVTPEPPKEDLIVEIEFGD